MAFEEVYTPPSNYEYRSLHQRFSFQASQLAYVLEAGIDASLGKHRNGWPRGSKKGSGKDKKIPPFDSSELTHRTLGRIKQQS